MARPLRSADVRLPPQLARTMMTTLRGAIPTSARPQLASASATTLAISRSETPMHLVATLHSTTGALLRAILLTLILPLSGAELRAQGAELTIGLTAAD